MPYYWTCPYCGANLDPGERCDCKNETNHDGKVDFGEYVPEGFGTCDCVMIGGDTLSITDYKHGKGVPVSAVGNPQMRLYALGALKRYAPVFGDTIKQVRMTIDQPRLDSYTSDLITVEELRAWGESIKPIAQKAFSGLGEFVPGEHCRFCRGKAQCRARANVNTALEDFKDCVPAGSVKPGEFVPQIHSYLTPGGVEVHPLLSDAEIGDLLIRGQQLVQWYKDLEEYATKALLDGKPIEGWKLVAGRSNRTFTDQDAAIKAVIAAGYGEALVYDRKPKTLSELEKLMGKISLSGLLALLGIPTAITAFCSWMLQRRITKREELQEARERAREKNEVLIIRSTGAAIALGEATAEALKNGHCNGEMEAALEYARKVKHEQKDFLTEQGVHALY